MRSRTIREGSVGLLIIVGLAVFIGLVLWLRNLTFGNRSYKFIVNFGNVAGMKVGAQVRYRGVAVGRITDLRAATNGVDVTVEITPPNLLIPRDSRIEANQAGLIGETAIDITPLKPLPSDALTINPLGSKCNSELVICNRNRLNGVIGVSFDELLRNTIRLSNVYSDPAFFNNVNALTKNSNVAAIGLTQLSTELSLLSRSARREIGTFSTAANSVTRAATQSTNQLGFAATRIGNTADRFTLTAAQLDQLIASTNDLVVSNRGTLVGTLDSVKQTSDQLRGLLGSLTSTSLQAGSTITQLNSTVGKANVGQLLNNLETLSTNAAQASANLRDITTSLNNPNSALLLQQTLDSARATFENTQKITSDLDELTGDPAFRENVKKLVNGLGNLVSSTEQLQQQVQVAQTIEPVRTAINTAIANATPQPSVTPEFLPKVEQAATPAPLAAPEFPPKVEQVAAPAPPNTQQQLLIIPAAPTNPSPEATSQPAAKAEGERQGH